MFIYRYKAIGCRSLLDTSQTKIEGCIEVFHQMTDSEVKMAAYANNPTFVMLKDFECKEIKND